jgi:uncharacterized membrane protein
VTGEVRRAGAFAAVGTLALAVPALGRFAVVAYLAVAAVAAFGVREGLVFELFARPGDRKDGKLYGLAGFALAATGMAFLATMMPVNAQMPVPVFVAAVLLLSYGNLGDRLVRSRTRADVVSTLGFGALGFAGGAVGIVAATVGGGTETPGAGTVVFLAASGVLLAALLRTVLFERDDPLVMLSTGLLMWLLWAFAAATAPGPFQVGVALAVTLGLGYASYALETASIPGMLTGVFLGLLTLVLGGLPWFATLIAFFGIGGLSTKYKYEVKAEHGVAEDNEGARGSGNVLGNSAVALLALLAYAAARADLLVLLLAYAGVGTGLLPPLDGGLAQLAAFAFAGSLAAAMSDTLSSEIGGVYENPRLVTTLEVVEPGTDGAVTWQGEVAGVAGAALVAAVSVPLGLVPTTAVAGVVVVVAGVVGMSVDSLLGATVEDRWLGNQGVNFFATLSGAVAGAALALLL